MFISQRSVTNSFLTELPAPCYVQVFRVEMRHGWLELSKWRSCIHQLEEMLISSNDPGFNSLIVRDKELTNRWTNLTRLLEDTEVVL